MLYLKLLWAFCVLLYVLRVETRSLYDNIIARNEYDYIIVGAGSTGSVLANRLSEDGQSTVLLLEAGGQPPGTSEVPLLSNRLTHTEIDWGYYSEPQKNACLGIPDQRMYYPRGKVLGGTSAINSMMYVRGNPRDYDDWASKEGAAGWSWNRVFPYFLKSEDQTSWLYKGNGYHSRGGPLTVSVNSFSTPIRDLFIKAVRSLGLPEVDINGPSQLGVSRSQVTVRGGLRCSTEKAFLRPVAHRENLDILMYSHVTRIQFDQDKRARWVHFQRNNRSNSVSARKEIVLSAGVFGSPQLLMLSGIGPKEQLDNFGIPVISDLPVGENLQDHVSTIGQIFSLNETLGLVFSRDISQSNIGELIEGKGPLTSNNLGEALAFINTKYASISQNWPDIQLHLTSGLFLYNSTLDIKNQELMKKYRKKDGLTIYPVLLRPKSRGYVRLRSINPQDHPIIQPQFFSDEQDLKVIVEGMKFIDQVIQSPYFQQFGPVRIPEIVPVSCKGRTGDAFLACLAETMTSIIHHPCCTCKMGDPWNPSTVVDPMLRVKGVQGLRVADASVMPKVVSANLNAPCIMIGEKAADMIRERPWDPIEDKFRF